MAKASPAKQLASFIAKFSPDVARQTKAALKKMRVMLPGAVELVYDNFNALAIGFCPIPGNERTSDAVFSIAVFPRRPSLVFIYGSRLRDPRKLLNGSGNQVRHIPLTDAKTLDLPGVRALMNQALKNAGAKPIRTASTPRSNRGRIVIKSISAKQRPRRSPAPKAPSRSR